MLSYRFVRALRAVSALALAATFTLSTLGPPSAASAAPAPEPAARFQLVVKEITIHDDNEGPLSGLGEMHVRIGILRCERGMALHACGVDGDEIAYAHQFFYASTDQKIRMDRLVPQADDRMSPGDASYELGIAAFTRHRYLVRLHISEDDGDDVNSVDELGKIFHLAYEAEHGLDVGTHTVQSVMEDGTTPGDYSVTFEIRRAPAPDLRPGSIKIHDLLGTTKKLVCMGVANHEPYDADAFETVLTIDGAVPPGGRASAGHLKGGAAADICVEVALPTEGQHTLGAVADASHFVAEYNETNNRYEMPWSATPTKTGAPEPSAAQADLTVSAIKVNGQAPDGKADCKNAKNTVIAVVKNGGKGTAGPFTTRLTVDGVDVAEQSAVDVAPGQEQEVRFENIELEKGQHKLTALVDANSQVAETNEDNNALTVSARC